MANPSIPPQTAATEFGMSIGAVLLSLLLLCQIAMAGGTVGFNPLLTEANCPARSTP